MNFDYDIKIVGDKPSEDIKRNRDTTLNADNNMPIKEKKAKARELGKITAQRFIDDAFKAQKDDSGGDFAMMIQRRLLLSFTATVAFDSFCGDETLAGIAEKSFLDIVKATDKELYKTSSDTGAFSFYYLAFRRGGEVERRMGQTFAMLCSHDGDPIFQELGEALYCWFSSAIQSDAKKLGLAS